MRSRRPRPWFVFVGAALGSMVACNGIIGENDIYFAGGDATTGGPESGSDVASGGDANATPDTGPCGDTQSSGDNCGTCGHSCLGGKCEMGLCQPVALASDISPREIYVDATHVFWIQPLTSQTLQAKLDGTNSLVLATSLNVVIGYAVDDTNVYWGSADDDIQRCKIDGCGGTGTFVTKASKGVQSIAVDATNLYWVGQDASDNSTIMKIAKTATNGTGTLLATSNATSMGFERIATDGAFVYWTADDGNVRRVPVGGGTMAIVGKGTGSALGIALDDQNVYWTIYDQTNGTINQAKKDGSSPNMGSVIAASQPLPLGLTVDATNVYWVNGGPGLGGTDGSVMTCTLGSCTPKTLATKQLAPVAIAVDKTAYYWSNYALGNPTGAVMRLAR